MVLLGGNLIIHSMSILKIEWGLGLLLLCTRVFWCLGNCLSLSTDEKVPNRESTGGGCSTEGKLHLIRISVF